MRRVLRLFLPVLMLSSIALAQTSDTTSSSNNDVNTLRVCVANLQNRTSRSFNTTVYRSQLVRFLNDLGTDKKSTVVIEAVPLNATSRKSAASESASNHCQYLLLTTVRDFSPLGSVGVGDGGISAIPGVSIGTGAATRGDRNIIVEFEASRIGRPSVVSEGTLQPSNSSPADQQITELVQTEAMRVAHDIRNDKVDWRRAQ